MYHANLDDLYLIPTAEVPVTNIFRDVILDEKELLLKDVHIQHVFDVKLGLTEKMYVVLTVCINSTKLKLLE